MWLEQHNTGSATLCVFIYQQNQDSTSYPSIKVKKQANEDVGSPNKHMFIMLSFVCK